MHSDHHMYLPTEIVVEIVAYVAADEHRRQPSLSTCCLISRQWYSAAITYLYEKPQLDSGHAFQNFTQTICPPIGVRRSKLNLGSLVRRLDLSHLVHHSSPSLTARLLGKVRENLEVFIAPRVSFSTNSLPALSKCHNLRLLDLSLVCDRIPFANLERSLSHLSKLLTLRLPRSTSITIWEWTFLNWPPNIHRLQLSGNFSPSIIPTISWPPRMTSLTLKNCDDLSVTSLASLMSSPHLSQSLKRLTISYANRGLQTESINAIPAFLPGLRFLSVPGDFVEDTFFDMLCYVPTPLALQVLELGYPCSDLSLNFSTASLLRALRGKGLANVRSVGFAEVFCTDQRVLEDEDVDEFLQERARKDLQSRSQATPVEGGEDGFVEPGVYYL